MAKLNTLKKNTDFKRAAACYRISLRYFMVNLSPNNGQGQRFGFTISKKTSKAAVHRNKAKRRLRELVRLHIKDSFFTDTDYVFISRPSITGATWQELEEDFRSVKENIETHYIRILRKQNRPLPASCVKRDDQV